MANFSTKKILILITIVFTGINIAGFCILNIKINDLQKYNNEKKSFFEQGNNKMESSNQKQECDFVKTFYVISILDNYDVDPDYMYIVVDQFQNFEPKILKVKKSIAKSIKEKEFYEFLFHGDSNLNVEDLEIISCSKTEKEGLEQRQESCLLEE